MRVLGDITADQKAMGNARCKIALTKTSSTPYTYYIDTGDDRILSLRHTEQEWSQTATVVVQDSDATLAALDMRGYKGVISYGYGANYSACAPLWVAAQRTDSTGGSIRTTLELKGTFDFLADDKASVAWTASDNYLSSVEDILGYVLTPSTGYAFYNHCDDYTLTVDSRDTGAGAVNTYAPKDYFIVALNESRLSVLKKLIGWVGCKLRVEADEAVHLFVPEASSAEYTYNDAATYHNFFSKAVRKRIVIPNYVVVSSHPDHIASYTNYKADTINDGDIELRGYHYIRAASDAQCLAIATAILKHHQLAAERGSGFVPMNCGQEVFDYVTVTDSRVGDSRSGNIGYIVRNYAQGEFTMRFGFGSLALSGIGAIPLVGADRADYSVTINSLIEAYEGLRLDLNQLLLAFMDIVNYLMARREVVPKWHIEKQAIMPVWIPGAPTVSTEAVTGIEDNDATANGTIDDFGVPNPTQHGVCYNTTGDPNITDDDVTEEGTPSGEGAFTATMSSLSADTLYYVRAYATNTTGTGYGIQVTFRTEEAA